VRLSLVARLKQPVALAVRPGDRRLYVAEKGGPVVAVSGGHVHGTGLDLSGQLAGGYEQGLLGLAFSPDGRFVYVDYTDTNGNTNVDQYRFGSGRADLGSRRRVLFVDQPYPNHNGGEVTFGPEGYLYVGLGDGGSEGDPENRGQDLGTLLGKILRIAPGAGGGYTVPNDNPFVGRAGARPEVWAYGLRNPWRFSFDRATGDLWIGDVGGSGWEEVDFQPGGSHGGENYEWALREGDHRLKGGRPSGGVDPVHEYSHDGGGCVVTGGFVYRGSDIPALDGAYVFADFCLGRLTALVQRDGQIVSQKVLGPRASQVASFGEDANGELYVLSLAGPLYRLVAP